jgi:hypothetical protein
MVWLFTTLHARHNTWFLMGSLRWPNDVGRHTNIRVDCGRKCPRSTAIKHDPHQTNCLASWDMEGVVTTAHGETRNSGRAIWRESGALNSLYMTSLHGVTTYNVFFSFITVLSLAKCVRWPYLGCELFFFVFSVFWKIVYGKSLMWIHGSKELNEICRLASSEWDLVNFGGTHISGKHESAKW